MKHTTSFDVLRLLAELREYLERHKDEQARELVFKIDEIVGGE